MTRLLAALLCTVLALPVLAEQAPAEKKIDKRSRLQGHAYVNRRDDVVGAVVRAHRMGDRSAIYLTSTDARGVFRIEGLPDGDYQVHIERAGYRPMSKDGITVRFPFRAVVELLMSRDPDADTSLAAPPGGGASSDTVRIRGRIVDPEARGVHEARVRLVRADGAVDPQSLQSSVDGSFEFDGIEAGAWWLSVQGVGTLPIRSLIDVAADTELAITLINQPASYEPSPLELMPPEAPIPPPAFVAPREELRASGAEESDS